MPKGCTARAPWQGRPLSAPICGVERFTEGKQNREAVFRLLQAATQTTTSTYPRCIGWIYCPHGAQNPETGSCELD